MTIPLSGWRTAIAFAALTVGCSTTHPGADNPGSIDNPGNIDQPGDPSSGDPTQNTPPDAGPPPDGTPQPPPAACMTGAPTGSVMFSLDTGVGDFNLFSDSFRTDLAVDAAGNVFYVRGFAGSSSSFSLTKYTPDGKVVYQVPFGEAVAVDAQGNAYVAASFSAPIDLGLGKILPQGDMDVVVAKLAPDGKLLFARALGVCPDSIRSIAVAVDGRIAVSGEEMGTLVLDAHGAVLFSRSYAGDLAFDSAGNLVIAGQFTGSIDLGGGAGFTTAAGDIDGFVVKLDCNGNRMWSYQIGDADLPVTLLPSTKVVSTPTRQAVTAVAVGPNDQIVISGRFDDDVKLFGHDIVASWIDVASVPLRSGAFAVALDAAGNPTPKTIRTAVDGYSDVAIDRAGNIIVTGKADAEPAPPFRYALLVKLDPRGAVLLERGSELGAGHAVAVDACGDMLWSASFRAKPDQPPLARLIKLAP